MAVQGLWEDIMNLSSKINKLQNGLRQYGKTVLITRKQVWLKEQDSVATKYIVTEPVEEWSEKWDKMIVKQVPLKETYSQIELVKFLADLVKEVRSG